MDDEGGAISATGLRDLAQVMAAALARQTGIREGADWGELVDRHLRRQVLDSYREELAASAPADAIAWLLERLAAVEARLLTLQAAALAPQAALDRDPLAQGFNGQAFLPTAATVYCDRELVHEGFYPVEYMPDGTPFRWIGPLTRAHVVLPKICPPIELQLTVSHIYVTDIVERVQVSLAGGEFVPVAVERHRQGAILTARPPAGPIEGARSVKLDIDVIRTECPRLRGEADGRELSVALSRIDMISLR